MTWALCHGPSSLTSPLALGTPRQEEHGRRNTTWPLQSSSPDWTGRVRRNCTCSVHPTYSAWGKGKNSWGSLVRCVMVPVQGEHTFIAAHSSTVLKVHRYKNNFRHPGCFSHCFTNVPKYFCYSKSLYGAKGRHGWLPCSLVRQSSYRFLLKRLMLEDHGIQLSLLLAVSQLPLVKRYWWMKKEGEITQTTINSVASANFMWGILSDHLLTIRGILKGVQNVFSCSSSGLTAAKAGAAEQF